MCKPHKANGCKHQVRASVKRQQDRASSQLRAAGFT